MVLQENISNYWSSFLGDNGYAAIGNGGANDWGGGTFAADVVDCSSTTRTFRLYNLDGSRSLYYGANLIITKLNPAITTSTTADNLGNHAATKNIELTGNYISNDGGNEGIKIDNAGNVGINTANPTTALDVTGNVNVTGKISLTDPTGSVTIKAAAFVDAGTFVTLDNLKATVTTSGSRGLGLATVSGTISLYVQGVYTNQSGAAYTSYTNVPVTYSTAVSGSMFGWDFGLGNTVIYHLTDATNSRLYRVTLIIMPSFLKNFISIERLL